MMNNFKNSGQTLPLAGQNSHSASVISGGQTYMTAETAATMRAMAVAADLDLPRYLLAGEIQCLLDYVPDLRQRLLLETLWNTGGRINEVLALTPADFHLHGHQAFVVLRTLKQRQRGRGRPVRGERISRAVALPDPHYQRRVREFIATFGLRQHERFWPLSSDNTPRNWISAAITRAADDNVTFPVDPITCHTFRHSFAMHLLLHGVPLKVIQAYLGHSRVSSTEIYTRIFTLDLNWLGSVRFSQ